MKETGRVREAWEDRARSSGNRLEGVLFGRLPPALNEALDRAHARVVQSHFLPRLPAGARVLDAGAGYGRLARRIREWRPDLCLFALDHALEYCQHCAGAIGARVACGDLAHPPFAAASFDGILLVTCLMYVSAGEKAGALGRVAQLLRPGGVVLLVEPNAPFMALARRLGGRASQTGGEGCSARDADSLIRAAGLTVGSTGGFPALSLLLPLALASNRLPRLQATLLSASSILDRHLGPCRRASLHHWLVAARVDGEE